MFGSFKSMFGVLAAMTSLLYRPGQQSRPDRIKQLSEEEAKKYRVHFPRRRNIKYHFRRNRRTSKFEKRMRINRIARLSRRRNRVAS